MNRSAAVLLLLPLLASCSRAVVVMGEYPEPRSLTAELRDAGGRAVGTVTLVEEATRVRVTAEVAALAPGEHGIHIHMRGECTPPGFASALGHFNPAGRAHGLANPAGPHAGDLPNLVVGPDGTARYEAASGHLMLSGPGAMRADSGAVVVHAGRDDQVSDPAGNAGARVACGVLRSSANSPHLD